MEDAIKTGLIPACPHCGQQPIHIATSLLIFPDDEIAKLFYCGNVACCKLFNMQIIGRQSPTALDAKLKQGFKKPLSLLK